MVAVVEGLCHVAAFVVRLKGGKLVARGRGWLLPTFSCSPSFNQSFVFGVFT